MTDTHTQKPPPRVDLSQQLTALHEQVRAIEAAPAPPLRNLEEIVDVRYSIDAARRLTEAELQVLSQATQLREEGLKRARTGNTADGKQLIQAARALLETEPISAEAHLLGESFQLAAEAFISYQNGHHAAAELTLLTAIQECCRLYDEYGYDVAMRRVHLGRNIIRLVSERDPLPALELAAGLLNYIEGDHSAWPWPHLAVDDAYRLSTDMRHALTDQVLSEIVRLVPQGAPHIPIILQSSTWLGMTEHTPPSLRFHRARHWLQAHTSAIRQDPRSFMEPATSFFAAPPARYVSAWRALTADLQALTDPPARPKY